MKFLVFSTDVLPLPGLPTSGTPLRTHGLIQGLRAHGHQVDVSVPRSALDGMFANCDVASLLPDVRAAIARLRDSAFDFTNQASLVDSARPDVVLCGHWPAATFQSRIAPALVIDLAGPHLLERHFQGSPDHQGAVLGKIRALSHADYFIVSGSKQRLYFLSFMLRARVDRPERRTITIHMPLNPELPSRPVTVEGSAYPRFVFAGVFLPWQDPTQALDRTAAAIAKRGRGSLTVIGGPHPNYPIANGVYADLVSRLAELPFVHRLPMLPYEEFTRHLAGADAAIDLMRWNLERELAMTIRSTTYLWAGVPVLYNDYADLGTLISRYHAGWSLSPSDTDAFDVAIDEVFDDPAAIAGKSAHAQQLAREVFSWDRAVTPLLDALGAEKRASLAEMDVDLAFPENASLAVLAGRPLEQHFLSRIDGLARVECCLATHARRRLQPLTMSLYRVLGDKNGRGDRELVGRRRIEAEAIRDNEWQMLEVQPIAQSGGQRFVLLIESEAREEKESVSPWAFHTRPFPLLDLVYGGRSLRKTSICLRTMSRPPVEQ
jgi:glycosyltransferase involved in cell wall biosynthesis